MLVRTPQQRLEEAREKLHLLRTGRLAVEMEVDGRKTRFARVDLDTLEGYVDRLEHEVAGRTPKRTQGISVRFG
jgi:hypothetical protein